MARSAAKGVTEATRIFLSYSRKDSDFVWRLRRSLEEKGYDAFLDTEQIAGGEEWKRRIEQLILAADAVVFVVSPDSVASPICDWETSRAVQLSKRLIPVVWRSVPDDLPPKQLADRNYIFFNEEAAFDRALAELCAACDVDIGWVREHTRLLEIAERWKTAGSRRDLLLRGSELLAAQSWRDRRTARAPSIPLHLEEFLVASESERRRAARQSKLLVAAFAILIVSLAGGYAFTQRQLIAERYTSWTRYRPFVQTRETLSRLDDGSKFQDCRLGSNDCPKMVIVPAGSFLMGSSGDGRAGSYVGSGDVPTIGRVYSLATIGGALDETPQRTISVLRFAVSETEITYAQWKACADAGGCAGSLGPRFSGADSVATELVRYDDAGGAGRDNLPAINVSWSDASAYVAWLSRMTGEDYRLLTEAEWEYAARGSARVERSTRFSWGDQDPSCVPSAPNGAAFIGCPCAPDASPGCSQEWSHPVASFHPNRFGLYDMHGNVWEWVEDCYRDRYDPQVSDSRAVESNTGRCDLRILRGGSWNNSPDYLRSAYRLQSPPDTRNRQTGFRVARTIEMR